MPSLEGFLSLPDFNLVTSLAFFLLAGRSLDCLNSAPLSASVEEVLSLRHKGRDPPSLQGDAVSLSRSKHV